MNTYCVYFLTNEHNKVLYIGVTNNLEKRLSEHRQGIGSTFTKKYNAHKLVYIETYSDIKLAIEREKQLKGWKRDKKNALVVLDNPDWKDLSLDWQ